MMAKIEQLENNNIDETLLPSLMKLAAEKAEAVLDCIQLKTQQDFIQIRAPFESILMHSPTGRTLSIIRIKTEFCRLDLSIPDWIQNCVTQTTEEDSPERVSIRPRRTVSAIQTQSKSYIYNIGQPSASDPSLDLREWFDDHAPRHPTHHHNHPFVQACLQEEGPSDLHPEDLAILENFIVASEGRDYIDTFRRRYHFVP